MQQLQVLHVLSDSCLILRPATSRLSPSRTGILLLNIQ